jgi:hypothetical protein
VALGLLVFAFWRTVAASRAAAEPDSFVPAAPAASGAAPSGASAPPPSSASPSPLPSSPAPTPAPPTPGGSPGPPSSSGAPAAGAAPAGPLDEARLMERLRAIKDQDPAAAVTLAREGNRRFPDSPAAPERTSILVHALVAAGDPSAARGEAEEMVNHYPDSSWVREVEQFTGAHRHRNIRVNDAGLIEYE